MGNLSDIAVRITADPTSFEAGVASAAQKGEAFAKSMTSSFANLKTNAMASLSAISAHPIGLLVTGLGSLFSALASYEKKAEETALVQAGLERRFGLSNAEAAGFQYQAMTAGVSVEELSGALTHFQRRLGEAAVSGGHVEQSLNALGLSSQELIRMPITQAYARFGDGLRQLENPSERAALSMSVVGRHGAALEPLLRQGSAGMEAARESAERLGLAMGENAQRIAASVRAQRIANAELEAVQTRVGSYLAERWAQIRLDTARFVILLTEGSAGLQRLTRNAGLAEQHQQNLSTLEQVNAEVERLNARGEAARGPMANFNSLLDRLRDQGATVDMLDRLRAAMDRVLGAEGGRALGNLQDVIFRAQFAMQGLRANEINERMQIGARIWDGDALDRQRIAVARQADAIEEARSLLEASRPAAERLTEIYNRQFALLQAGRISLNDYLHIMGEAERRFGDNAPRDSRLAAGIASGSSDAISFLHHAQMELGNSSTPDDRVAQRLDRQFQVSDIQRELLAQILDAVRSGAGFQPVPRIAMLP
jgi:hypothetical protein